jgi:hypothetical protein
VLDTVVVKVALSAHMCRPLATRTTSWNTAGNCVTVLEQVTTAFTLDDVLTAAAPTQDKTNSQQNADAQMSTVRLGDWLPAAMTT